MADALEYTKILAPWTDGLPVLVSHDPRDLVQMG